MTLNHNKLTPSLNLTQIFTQNGYFKPTTQTVCSYFRCPTLLPEAETKALIERMTAAGVTPLCGSGWDKSRNEQNSTCYLHETFTYYF